MKKINYGGSSKILNGIVTKINAIIDSMVVDVKVNDVSVVDENHVANIDLTLADQNVKQSPTTDNADYRILLSKSANDTEETDISRKNTNFKYNPSTGNLQVTKVNGNTVPSGSGNDTLAKTSDIPDMTNYIQKSLTVGLIKNDGTIDQTQYATMSDIPDELADLADDVNHRLVTDTEKSTWNNNRAISKELTNETLDAITDPGFYYAGSGNTCSNKPSGVYNFGMIVLKTNTWGYSSVRQILISDSIAYGMERKQDGYGNWTDWYTCEGRTVDQSVIQDITDYAYPLLASPTPDNGEEITDEINAVKKTAGMFWHSRFKELEVREGSINAQTYKFNLLGDPYGSLSNPYGSDVSLPNHDGTLTTEKNAVLWKQQNVLGAKNLLPYPYEDTTKSVGTLNFTDNGDGTITINGTANSNARFYIDETISNPINYPLKGGLIYKFSRGYTTQTDAYIFIRCYYTANLSNNESVLVELKNEDKNIDLTNYPTIYGIRIGIVVANGTVVNNITFKPMIRLASITDETWEPFAKTNYWLTKDQYTQEQNNILGAKNLITFPYYHGFSRTTNNVVFTVDNDGIITVGGTQASGNASFYLMYNVKLPNGTYTLSDGGVGTADTYLSCVYYTTPSASAQYYDVANNGSVTFTVNNWDRAIIRIWSRNGKTADNLVFKPMLRLSTIVDSTFEPYAETNRQLTVTKLDISEIASVENSNTASQAYAVGDYMIWRGGFYRVVSAISSGGTITLNTNVTKTTLGAELKRALT